MYRKMHCVKHINAKEKKIQKLEIQKIKHGRITEENIMHLSKESFFRHNLNPGGLDERFCLLTTVLMTTIINSF